MSIYWSLVITAHTLGIPYNHMIPFRGWRKCNEQPVFRLCNQSSDDEGLRPGTLNTQSPTEAANTPERALRSPITTRVFPRGIRRGS
jgi:hypothetical protein